MAAQEIPSGSVIITPEHMWKAIETIKETGARTEQAVSRLELTLNPALTDIRGDLQTLDDRESAHHEHHNKLIQDLQQASWSTRWVPALVTSLLCSVAGGIVLYIVTRGLSL